MVNDQQGVPRLGVPPFGHTECTHGTLNDGQLLTTLFPQAITFAGRYPCNYSTTYNTIIILNNYNTTDQIDNIITFKVVHI